MAAATPKAMRLAAVPLFAGLTRAQLRKVEHLTDEVPVSAGTRLTAQGGLGSEFFLIESGQVSVRRDGREVNLLGPGSYFGELALLGAPLRNADCVATTDAALVVIGAREFTSLLHDVPEIAVSMLHALARRLQDSG